VTLDPDKTPFSTEMVFTWVHEVYAYDDFVLNEYIDKNDREISYEVEFNKGFISPDNWDTKTNRVIHDVEEYHRAKYPNSISIESISVIQGSDKGNYKTYWTLDRPDELRFWTPQ